MLDTIKCLPHTISNIFFVNMCVVIKSHAYKLDVQMPKSYLKFESIFISAVFSQSRVNLADQCVSLIVEI